MLEAEGRDAVPLRAATPDIVVLRTTLRSKAIPGLAPELARVLRRE